MVKYSKIIMEDLWNYRIFLKYTYYCSCSCSNNYFSNKKINDNKKIRKKGE